MTILVVDDDIQYRLLLRSVLLREGMDVILACNGEEALERLKGTKVDLVICDIYMPIMDGMKLNKALRATTEFEKLPMLFVSGNDDQHTMDAVKDARYDSFIRKVTPVPELMAWIRYLTTPVEKRSGTSPGSGKTSSQVWSRDESRTGARPLIW